MRIKPEIIIGISGGSGSGKTYILNKLIHAYPSTEICLLSQDHYYKPLSEQQFDENGEVNFDLPESIYEDELWNDIQQLKQGLSVEKLEYTFNHPELEPSLMILRPAPILVIEGLFIFHLARIAKLLDIRVFIESDRALCLERRIIRDIAERSLTREQVVYQWNYHVQPAYEHYLLPYRELADILITNKIGEPELDPIYKSIAARRYS